jgi:hypothetical protein
VTVRIVPLRNSPRPGVIDEITADRASVHIERMSEDRYWLRIDDDCFELRAISTVKQRPVAIDLTKQ